MLVYGDGGGSIGVRIRNVSEIVYTLRIPGSWNHICLIWRNNMGSYITRQYRGDTVPDGNAGDMLSQ